MAKLKTKMPEKIHDLLDWVIALNSWDYREPRHLCRLIETKEIPKKLRKSISLRLAGEIKPKSTANLKSRPTDRLYIGYQLYFTRHLKESERAEADMKGDKLGIEPIKIIRACNQDVQNMRAFLAAEWGLSEKAVENAYQAFVKKIKNLEEDKII